VTARSYEEAERQSGGAAKEEVHNTQRRGFMTRLTETRRGFNHASLVSLLATAVAVSQSGTALAQQGSTAAASTRREVIKQKLPGEPERDLVLIEVTFPAGAVSPVHFHPNGVMAFVVSGSIVSKVNEGSEQTYHTGDAWWEPPGAIHRVSRNASTSEPAKLLAIYIAPKDATPADLMKPI
jgi:quercetin dioxygenase-like cupin family protein